jgi:hypothetical protein
VLQIQIFWAGKLCVGVIDPEASNTFLRGQIHPEKRSIIILRNIGNISPLTRRNVPKNYNLQLLCELILFEQAQ